MRVDGRREHGTRTCAVHGPDRRYQGRRCHCAPCLAANAAYELERARRVEPPYVDATSARDHIAWLARHGVGLKTVAKTSGVSHGALWKLIYGVPSIGRPPTRRIRPATRNAILAIRPNDGADGSLVDAAPTWATINTLVERGWTKVAIARAIGQTGPGLQVARTTVQRGTARRIARLLDQPVPPRRSRHGIHPVPQPAEPDRQQALRDEARRAQAAERQAAHRAKTRATQPGADTATPDYELPTLDLNLTLTTAPCRQPKVPTWLFFPDPGDTETEDRAKAVCATCPNTTHCVTFALAHDETGIWGGTTDADRDGIRKLRQLVAS